MSIENWQAIIFDFDGVIVESGDIKTQAFAELYRSYGEHVVTEVSSLSPAKRRNVPLPQVPLFSTAFVG